MRVAGINDFPNASLADVAAALPVLRDYGVPLVVHAELDDGTTAQARPPHIRQRCATRHSSLAVLLGVCKPFCA